MLLQGRERRRDTWSSNEGEGKGRGAYVFLCVFLRAASGSCGVGSRRETGIPKLSEH